MRSWRVLAVLVLFCAQGCGEPALDEIDETDAPDAAVEITQEQPGSDALAAVSDAGTTTTLEEPDGGADVADELPGDQELGADEVVDEREASATGRELKVMTLNIRGRSPNLGGVSALINRVNPDVVGLQEVNWAPVVTTNQALLIATQLRLQYGKRYYYAFQSQHSWIVYGLGVAVLSKYPIANTHYKILPKVESENRIVLHATIKSPGRWVNFFVTHLSNNHADGDSKIYQQAVAATGWINTYTNYPRFVVGDFNTGANTKVYTYMSGRFIDGWKAVPFMVGGATMSADKPTVRFDYIYGSQGSGLRPLSAMVLCEPSISDHCGIIQHWSY